MIIEFKHKLISGKPCMVHSEFFPAMDLFCRYLELSGCSAHINSSYREKEDHLSGAIVEPATMGNHYIGHAFDCNIYDKKKKMWTSDEMKTPKDEVLVLINLVRRSTGLRWGGDFIKPDTVHFDDATNIKFPKRWHDIYDQLHSNH